MSFELKNLTQNSKFIIHNSERSEVRLKTFETSSFPSPLLGQQETYLQDAPNN
jgi:hypothetical protein